MNALSDAHLPDPEHVQRQVRLPDQPVWQDGNAAPRSGELEQEFHRLGRPARGGAAGGGDEEAGVDVEAVFGTRAAIQQVVRLFGPEGSTPRATLVKDWAQVAWTATPADTTPTGQPPAFEKEWVTSEWQGRLIMAGSEASPSEPGFLAGAVVASQLAAERVAAG